ncbi:E3 ubiquitin-protein ligase TRIM16-like [Chanos chanos]|uniref:E3 ubiquitin-protein ligase TRIM16-like n=1 Tax=Chanos chanos TaxID=29144 RepID=A0A6J2VSY4_CHACN|nr:E3 ubiquitin-protein ligase TRIM16-like [Chanos chanos]
MAEASISCRQTFRPRPPLHKNTILTEMVEKLKRRRLQNAPHPSRSYSGSGSGNVECGVCTGKKLKAIKSCLVCLDSYCQTHFEQHDKLFKEKRHKMTDVTGQLEERICSLHERPLEVFCRTDQQCVCVFCVVSNHRRHEIISSAAARAEKKNQFGMTKRKLQRRIQEREKEVQELRQAVESLRRSAQAAVEDSERIFTEMIRSIERRRREVTELIRDQEKSELNDTEGVLKRLEQEIADLRRRDTELEQLSQTEDHIHFLQSFPSLCAPPRSANFPSITVSPHFSFEDVGKSVSQLKERLQNFCKEELGRLSKIKIILPHQPRSREEFLQYSCQFKLDPNTAQGNLCLSEGNRVVTWSNTVQSYPDHPERFGGWEQVLCGQSVTARCYWEAEWEGKEVDVVVSYKGIGRTGRGVDCVFGRNDQSWSLTCSLSSYSFRHNNKITDLPIVPSSSRVGVYVDHRAGTLSFYSVSDTMTLLHRVHTTFTQPLYPGFGVGWGSKVRLCHHPK